MWHKLTLFGKVLLFLVGFGFGLATGVYSTKKAVESNYINIDVDKVKRNSSLDINMFDIKQGDKKVDNNKRKRRNR